MKLWSDCFSDRQPIAETNAMGRPNAKTHAEMSDNKSPHLAWINLPEGTRSLVLLCVDTDAPSSPDNVNKEGVTVAADLPRGDFHHWVLVDIPGDASSLEEGEFADGIVVRGKESPGPRGTRSGLNDYTNWFAGDPDMQGKYFGYDGPFPPWNDEIVHHYHFTLYATDLERCPVDGEFTGPDVTKAIEGHVLGQATIVGTYHICPDATVKL